MGPTRVVIADDHPFFRRALAQRLTQFGIEVVGEAAHGWGAIETVEETAPDVVVLDFNMPLLSGVDVIRRLAERAPGTRVLVLSVSADETDVTDAILAGARGYVLKEGPVEDVVAGVRALAGGEALISPRIASLLLHTIREGVQAKASSPGSLTTPDIELLRLVAEGMTNDEIGGVLTIDADTVGRQVSAALTRLQTDARTRTAVRAARNGHF